MSELAGDQRGDVFLLGQIAQEVGDYFVLIRRYEEAIEEYEEAVTAYGMVAADSSVFDKAQKLMEIVRKCLNKLKGEDDSVEAPSSASSGLLDKIREFGEALKDMVSPGIQWELAFEMSTKTKGDDDKSIRLPGMIRIAGDRKEDEVCLNIGSAAIPREMEQIPHEILTKFLNQLNSGEETFYYQILLKDPDGKWSVFPDDPEEIYNLEIPVPDTVPDDRFILLLHTESDKLKENTKTILTSLNNTGTPGHDLSSLLVMRVDIRKS
ncbi:hypothetical protein QUF72_18670 [Desulfobacterales bacterium HSG2]|nr:hypothetical protein [Desulfobacterales bacterium HSG2]